MKQVQPDIWETEMQSPFPGLKTHAYLWIREEGNVLFYNTGHSHEIARFGDYGGVERQYLSHQDELGETLNEIAEHYGSILFGHSAELEAYSKVRSPDRLIERRETHLGCIEAIPTPGHSPGSTCFQVDSPTGKRYLFTGDTLYLDRKNRWTAGFIPGVHDESIRPALADSLRTLRTLNPDVVFGSAFVGDYGFEEIPEGTWPGKVDAALDRLLAKSSSGQAG